MPSDNLDISIYESGGRMQTHRQHRDTHTHTARIIKTDLCIRFTYKVYTQYERASASHANMLWAIYIVLWTRRESSPPPHTTHPFNISQKLRSVCTLHANANVCQRLIAFIRRFISTKSFRAPDIRSRVREGQRKN